MLDVMQIFGRAGRPQFDTSGHGIIITTHNKLSHYLSLLTHQKPIGTSRNGPHHPTRRGVDGASACTESSFIKALPDHLNAEIVSGTVTSIQEAVQWLSYTYLYIRMLRNSLAYGINTRQRMEDPLLLDLYAQLPQPRRPPSV